MIERPSNKIFTVVLPICVAESTVFGLLLSRINKDQVFGCLAVSVVMFSLSFVIFLVGAWPYRARGATDRTLRRAFAFACFALACSALWIPVWSLLAHQFPPQAVSPPVAYVLLVVILIALLGPGAPWIVIWTRYVRALNREQAAAARERRRQRKR